MIGLGAYRVSRGFLSAADLIAFILYAEMVAGPVSTLAGLYIEVSKAVAAYQRIEGILDARGEVARAFLVDPRILILDEATSALDAHAEREVQRALDALMRGRTTLIIAHRLSTIEGADRIVVLKEGRVLDSGTHDALLARCPFYRDLYEAQFAPWGERGRASRLPEPGKSGRIELLGVARSFASVR